MLKASVEKRKDLSNGIVQRCELLPESQYNIDNIEQQCGNEKQILENNADCDENSEVESRKSGFFSDIFLI